MQEGRQKIIEADADHIEPVALVRGYMSHCSVLLRQKDSICEGVGYPSGESAADPVLYPRDIVVIAARPFSPSFRVLVVDRNAGTIRHPVPFSTVIPTSQGEAFSMHRSPISSPDLCEEIYDVMCCLLAISICFSSVVFQHSGGL